MPPFDDQQHSKFIRSVMNDWEVLNTSLPSMLQRLDFFDSKINCIAEGIWVRAYEGNIDLLTMVIVASEGSIDFLSFLYLRYLQFQS